MMLLNRRMLSIPVALFILVFCVDLLVAQREIPPEFPRVQPANRSMEFVAISIHEAFETELKDASLGKAVDVESEKEQIQASVEQQIKTFIESANGAKTAKALKEAAEKAQDSMGLHDEIVAALTYELECTPMPKMELDSMRETLDDVGVHLNWDYTLVAGAIPPELTQVRVRLPKLHACGGCKQRVENTMNGTDGFKDVVVDLKTLTLQFLVNKEFEVAEKLDALEKSGLGQLTGWKRVR